MSDARWSQVRALIESDRDGSDPFTLGPYFSHQLRRAPRHVLFTLSRYKFAAKLLPQDHAVSVLELGCAEGVGSLLLAEPGHLVTGVDFDADAICHARRALAGAAGLEFVASDFLGQRFGCFDVVVSLDVIEHIAPEREREFLDTVAANLGPEGFCVIGTPNATAAMYASEESRIGHVNLFCGERLVDALGSYFQNVFLFGMNDEVVHTGFRPMCHYLVALAVGLKQKQKQG